MTIRIVTRLTLLLVALAAATAVMIGGLSLLASATPGDATALLGHDQVAAVERAIEAPQPTEARTTEASDAAPTPAIVLVFAGIVLMAALPPIHRVHVYHRSYHGYDWPRTGGVRRGHPTGGRSCAIPGRGSATSPPLPAGEAAQLLRSRISNTRPAERM